jgi:hypothetical protein
MRSSVRDMQAALPARAAGQRVSASALSCASASAALAQRGLDALLDDVDLGAARLLLLDRQRGHALQQLGHATGLAEETRLRVLQVGRRGGGGEIGFGGLHQEIEVVHVGRRLTANGDGKRKGRHPGCRPCRRGRCEAGVGFDRRQPRKAGRGVITFKPASLHLGDDAAKGGRVVDGHVGRTLRSSSIDAFFRPAMKRLYVTPCERAPALIRAIHSARITVGVLARLHHRLLGNAVDVLAATAVALGEGENLLVAGASRYTTFDARHE